MKKSITFGFLSAVASFFLISCASVPKNGDSYKKEGAFVRFPAGEFSMGSEKGYPDNAPAHSVKIESAFYICEHEVTQGEYESVMGKNPSAFSDNAEKKEKQKNRPVDSVNWFEAVVYCNRLSAKEKREPVYALNGNTNCEEWGEIPVSASSENYVLWRDGISQDMSKNGYRLPTEAEWEYAARAGNADSASIVFSGNPKIEKLGDYAWYTSNSSGKTHEVKKKNANEAGLYDMSGNVWEWCWDSWDGTSDYAGKKVSDHASLFSFEYAPELDPENDAEFVPDSREYYAFGRVRRGGSWFNTSPLCAVSFRNCYAPFIKNSALGFRVVRTDTKSE